MEDAQHPMHCSHLVARKCDCEYILDAAGAARQCCQLGARLLVPQQGFLVNG